MTTTPHLGITLLETAQAQKEVTVNEALYRIDALLNTGAIARTLTTPPASPASGDVYLIPTGATGAWSGKAGQITYFDQLWRFIVPRAGSLLAVQEDGRLYRFDGTNWRSASRLLRHPVTSANAGSAYSLNPDVAEAFHLTLNAASCAFTFTAPADGDGMAELTLFLKQDATGGRTVTFPASVKWPGGVAPTLTASANATDSLHFLTLDGGANWNGRVLAQNY
jgi:hypothetical protein